MTQYNNEGSGSALARNYTRVKERPGAQRTHASFRARLESAHTRARKSRRRERVQAARLLLCFPSLTRQLVLRRGCSFHPRLPGTCSSSQLLPQFVAPRRRAVFGPAMRGGTRRNRRAEIRFAEGFSGFGAALRSIFLRFSCIRGPGASPAADPNPRVYFENVGKKAESSGIIAASPAPRINNLSSAALSPGGKLFAILASVFGEQNFLINAPSRKPCARERVK